MITCPNCGHQNRAEAKFCQHCGTSFSPERELFIDRAAGEAGGPAQGSAPPTPDDRSRREKAAPAPGPGPGREMIPLQPGSVLYHPQDPKRRYGIVKVRELERSIYYDALVLTCRNCSYEAAVVPHNGLCRRCQAPLDVVLVHERRAVSPGPRSEAELARLIQLSSGHNGILPHRDIVPYAERVFTVTQHPGRWRVLVRGRQQRSLDEALAGAVHVGQALSYLHNRGYAYTEVGGASLESLVVVGAGMNIKLADLSLAAPLPADDAEAAQALINRDIAFLANLIFYLVTGKPLVRSGVDSAPVPLHGLIERAMQAKYENIQGMLNDVCCVPFELSRPLKATHGQASHIGKKSQRNEDAIITFTFAKDQGDQSVPMGFYLVADGMGGHDAGEIASRMVNQTVTDWIINIKVLPDLRNVTRELMAKDVPGDLLTKGIKQANDLLLELGKAKDISPGATVTTALVIGDLATVANVGDSRTYLLRAGKLEPVTQDHSLVARLVDAGVITADKVREHPQRNQIYRCLGQKADVEVDTFAVQLQRGDRLILCSDGLWEMVLDPDIQRIVEQARSPQQACDALVDMANRAGGDDNISVIVVEME